MPTEEQIREWKERHGEVYEIRGEVEDGGGDQVFYFRKPGWADLSRFAREVTRDLLKAANNLVYGCLLHPAPEVLRRMVDEKPGLIMGLAGELQKIVGSSQDFLARKL
jgi:hypothetical protein